MADEVARMSAGLQTIGYVDGEFGIFEFFYMLRVHINYISWKSHKISHSYWISFEYLNEYEYGLDLLVTYCPLSSCLIPLGYDMISLNVLTSNSPFFISVNVNFLIGESNLGCKWNCGSYSNMVRLSYKFQTK